MSKKIIYLLIALCTLSAFFILFFAHNHIEGKAHYTPDYTMTDLSSLLDKSSLSDSDYALLFYQTGLSKESIQTILKSAPNPALRLKQYQDNFFNPIDIACTFNSPISKEERIIPASDKKIELAPLQDGDILITSASHTFFWRNGHAALVVDSKSGKTLESVVLGENSSIQTTNKWTGYPNFVILRLKNMTPSLADRIVTTALTYLNDIPYDFTVGILSKKEKTPDQLNGTQCAHLVWEAFILNGYDIDADGGALVTPADILSDENLEIVQIYGVNPDSYVERSR